MMTVDHQGGHSRKSSLKDGRTSSRCYNKWREGRNKNKKQKLPRRQRGNNRKEEQEK
jgi:hypothetical protein